MKKRFFAFIFGTLSALVALFALHSRVNLPHVTPFLKKMELQTVDYRMKLAKPSEVSDAIKIILVNDVNNLSNKLAAFTRLVSSEEFKPKVIGFNYLFDASVNEELITEASMANNIYYGYSFVFDRNQSEPQPPNYDILPFHLEITNLGEDTSNILEAPQVQLPSNKYLMTARGIGFVNTLPDIDGIYRRIPIFLKYQDYWYGSLALLMAMEYMDIESVDIILYPGQYVEIAQDDGSFMKIPVNQYGELQIDFTYNPESGEELAPFETFSMEDDILAWSNNVDQASTPLNALKDAIVLVGSISRQPIPLNASYPLIGIHANFINNILNNHFIRELPPEFTIGLVLLVGMITGLLLTRRRILLKLFSALLLAGLYGLICYGVFYQFRLLLPVVQPLLAIGITFFSVGAFIRHAPVKKAVKTEPQPVKEKKRKVKTSSDELSVLQHNLIEIREELDRKSLRLRSKAEELRMLQEQVESSHYDYSRQVASLQKEIRAREIEIKGLIAKEEELRRQVENLPFTDPSVTQGRYNTEELIRLFAKYGFITNNEQILHTLIRVEKLSNTSVALLIQGEPGTGKKLLAQIIRELSSRQNRPFLEVICDGDMDMLEDDLFGHRQGAFPGADDHRLGLLRKVEEGTLVLVGLGNLSLEIQTRLVQACRGKAVRPLGEDHGYPIDVRMIATTSQNLQELVSSGKFRQDLYHYFSIFPLYLPPLRDRKEDLPAIVSYFITKYNHVHSKIVETVSESAMHLLLRHQWPGNIAELEKVIERAIAEVNPGERELTERNLTFEEADMTGGIPDPGMLSYLIALMDNEKELPAYQPLREKVLAEIQRLYCIRLMRRHNGNVKSAAIEAGLKQETFKKMLSELMVEPENYRY